MHIKEIQFKWGEKYSIFISKQFLESLSREYGWVGGFINNDLVFVLPYNLYKKPGFKIIRFSYNEICIEDNLPNYDFHLKDFLNSTVSYFNQKGIDLIIQPPTHVLFNNVPDDSIFTQYGTYYIDLSNSKEILWKNVHSKHRNSIRKGMKNSIIIKTGNNQKSIAYNLIRNTFKRSNKGFMSAHNFDILIEKLVGNIKIFVAYHNDIAQGCAVIPYSKHTAYYSHGGSISKPKSGALNYLQWFVIKYFKEKGVQYYDFAGARISPIKGSKAEGIQRFKERFGADFRTGYLWKFPFNKTKFFIYSTAYRILKDKNGDIIDQENIQ